MKHVKGAIKKKINKWKEKSYLEKLRKRNNNEDVTIVCNNCVGGVIYHNLGLQFQSPTVNLFIRGEEYLEFVKNFEYYSTCELEEFEDPECSYPVGRLVPKDDDHFYITVFFQHYHTFDEAKNKWQERFGRVNWNNIYFIWEFYDTLYDQKLMYEFDKLEYVNKVILCHKKFEGLQNAFVVNCYNNDKPTAKILEYKGCTGKRYLEEFDYVKFLNSKV